MIGTVMFSLLSTIGFGISGFVANTDGSAFLVVAAASAVIFVASVEAWDCERQQDVAGTHFD